ncbi:MAG: hypothetical protein J5J06_13795 [Phycisphaerae bacterium]|nr:hypothetical protein [Phycisphaerae bacterium]
MKRTKYKALEVVRRIPALDVEDFQHDLIEDVLRRLPKYNADRAGVRTFICRIIDNKVADLLKARDAKRRGNGHVHESLDDWVHDETGAWSRRKTTIDASRLRAHRGAAPRSNLDRRDLEMDVAATVAVLPAETHGLCAMLSARSPTDVSRMTRPSRTTIYREIAALRPVFAEANLHLYVPGIHRRADTPAPAAVHSVGKTASRKDQAC